MNVEVPISRQYIGARYIPKIEGDWDNTKSYDPLTVVYYNGASYTSRTYVPVGININNTTYWALSADYNAQVAAYRAEVLRMMETTIAEYETVADVIADNDITEGEVVSTSGYYSINDSGAAIYKIVSSGNYQIALDNGLYGRVIHNGVVNIAQFGASESDGAKTKAAFDAILAAGIKNIIIPKGNWLITGSITLTDLVTITGESYLNSRITQTDITADVFIIGTNDDNASVNISDVQIWNTPSSTNVPNRTSGSTTGASNKAINIVKGVASKFNKVKINRFQYGFFVASNNYTIDFNTCLAHACDNGIYLTGLNQAINIFECDFDNDRVAITVNDGIGSNIIDKCQIENSYIGISKATGGSLIISQTYFDGNGRHSMEITDSVDILTIDNCVFLESVLNSEMIYCSGVTGVIVCSNNVIDAGANTTALINGVQSQKFNINNIFKGTTIFASNPTNIITGVYSNNINQASTTGAFIGDSAINGVANAAHQRYYNEGNDITLDFSNVSGMANHSHLVIEGNLSSGKTITFTGGTFQTNSYTNNSGSTEHLLIYCVKIANSSSWDNLIIKSAA